MSLTHVYFKMGALIVLFIVLVIGTYIGRYLESGVTQKERSKLIHEKRAAEKSYQDKVKTLEKDLKKLKGDLGMD